MIGFSDRRVRLLTVVVGVAGLIAAATTPAAAQDISVNFAQGSGLTDTSTESILDARFRGHERSGAAAPQSSR